MRGAEAEDMANGPNPAVSTLLALMARASRDQPAHTVADQNDLLHGDGPCVDQFFHFRGQQRAVFRNVETGIVAEVERRVAEVLFQKRSVSRLAVAVLFFRVKPPHLLVARETMNEHGELSAGAGVCTAESRGVHGDGSTPMTKLHAGPQTVSIPFQTVAYEPVQRADGEIQGGGQRLFFGRLGLFERR